MKYYTKIQSAGQYLRSYHTVKYINWRSYAELMLSKREEDL